MKWFKKNKLLVIAVVLFSVITLVGYKALKIFFPSTDAAIYGDRLDNKIKVEQEVYDKLKDRLSGQEFVKKVTVRESGRTVNILVTVMDSTSISASKDLSKLVLEGFSDSQIGYYDFQLMVVKEDEKENDFPIMAYKQHNSTEFVWNRDRQKTEPIEEGEEK